MVDFGLGYCNVPRAAVKHVGSNYCHRNVRQPKVAKFDDIYCDENLRAEWESRTSRAKMKARRGADKR